jgi:hypothetical protein
VGIGKSQNIRRGNSKEVKMGRYAANARYAEKFRAAFDKGEAVELEVRDEETYGWRNVKAIVSSTEMEGADPLTLLDDLGVPLGETRYIKIIEDLAEERIPLSIYEDPLNWSGV